MAIDWAEPNDDAQGGMLVAWDISEVAAKRVFDVREWESAALTVRENAVTGATWATSINAKWSAHPDGDAAEDFASAVAFSKAGVRSSVIDVKEEPYLLLEPASAASAGETVDVYLYLSRTRCSDGN